ncbi:D-tyrosyl-tRNA(Tyr) deacylase [Hydrogenispora ethanolica]|jgi:D-tyrosyl-tRNA(Tyr) deacylase|uniref:D-aminoacyl-tRNA deacylase n=1 Tax=Hydrogenispora ethanolica TaxID=1082276 RepID=A0A4R1RGW8_HYDET|nr:D-aminoacyl-tRNA deacylase [Hydrogenispora ethanolica]TCL65261.1 D-tyrosyl-tRNA(Tyr) deacylase [Hydrogenispora ethanolica]
MRAVIQRVQRAQVTVDGAITGAIGPGLAVLLGVGQDDSAEDVAYLAEKAVNLRIFPDEQGKLNLSCLALGLPVLVVSQFTLYGDCRNGRRPSFTEAAPPELGEALYEAFCSAVAGQGLTVARGRFRSHMLFELVNDGPVTILLDSKKLF